MTLLGKSYRSPNFAYCDWEIRKLKKKLLHLNLNENLENIQMAHVYNSTLIIILSLKCTRIRSVYDLQDDIKSSNSGPSTASGAW